MRYFSHKWRYLDKFYREAVNAVVEFGEYDTPMLHFEALASIVPDVCDGRFYLKVYKFHKADEYEFINGKLVDIVLCVPVKN